MARAGAIISAIGDLVSAFRVPHSRHLRRLEDADSARHAAPASPHLVATMAHLDAQSGCLPVIAAQVA